jgi:hypothetical protein
MSYRNLSKERLAEQLVEVLGLSNEVALSFVELPEGSDKAVELLEAQKRGREQQAELTRSREQLRAVTMR